MSIRTRHATDDEIAAVEPLYIRRQMKGGVVKRIHKGPVVRQGLLGKSARYACSLASVALWGYYALALALFGTDALMAGAVLGASWRCWQVRRYWNGKLCPIENVATQALKVATGERNSVQHLNRSDELGPTPRAVGSLA